MRNLYLFDFINPETIKPLCQSIIDWNSEDDDNASKVIDFKREPINIYINSGGGELPSCLAMVDVIIASKTPINTIGLGDVMSSAFIIFMVGHKRYSYKHTQFMYHLIQMNQHGSLSFMKCYMKYASNSYTVIEELVQKHTNITKEQLQSVKDTNIDWYISPDEALELKVVDEII